jgi:protein-S-isoprenylcysteine O-methyltransferase Ste14
MSARARFSSEGLIRLQQSRIYDWVMRVPLLAYAVVFATLQMAGLARYSHEAQVAPPAYAIGMAMRLSTIAFLLLLAASAILRARPTGKARGLEPRITAFIGAFLVYVFPLLPRRELSVTAEMISTLMVLAGSSAGIVALLQLGRSFSMMSEARRLVTSGFYRFVRHPLYLAEELAIVGIFIQFASVWTALILVVQIAFQLRRMYNEELILAKVFPEYTAYCDRTARLIPGVY